MHSDEHTRFAAYGSRLVYGASLITGYWTLMTLGLLIGAVIENALLGRHPVLPEMALLVLAMGIFSVIYPISGFLMYSPRTRFADITVGTDQDVPALMLRQSGLIYILSVMQLAAATAVLIMMVNLGFGPGPHPFASGWTLMIIIVSGWQVGVVALMALRRIRPGYIAIRHDGIRIRGYVNDAWVPWDSVSPYLFNSDSLFARVHIEPEHRVVISSRVPRMWMSIDKRQTFHAHPSRPRKPIITVSTDRRRYRIAPEIIDAALNHYTENPTVREELRDAAAIARTVDTLRSHAPKTWWRSQTRPVPLPTLTVDPHQLP
ncbi:hypothetical protein [Rhodococcus artemisiae]|uniref:PH (Pleckstrin Homology) domain-containing protein n=1 Tax=Rhodococcus artemisiae TaxID=714159 RepID=A0ABU7L4W5_9NOCA|nr:hypothetical protein [Rhodococcus artemisiae]MEE2056585.1 hypothetical protein [Rhodococcus artemisiae]